MKIIDSFQRNGFFRAFVITFVFVGIINYFLFLGDWASGKSNSFALNIFFIILSIFFLAFILIWYLVVYLRRRNAILNFIPQECELIKIIYDNSNSNLLDIHARIAYCKAISPINGKMKEYKSNRFWFVPGDHAEPGFKMKIYFDPNDNNRFYVDTKSLY